MKGSIEDWKNITVGEASGNDYGETVRSCSIVKAIGNDYGRH